MSEDAKPLIPENMVRFVEKDGFVQLQLDAYSLVVGEERRKLFAQLLLNDVAKLEQAISKASKQEIDSLNDILFPNEPIKKDPLVSNDESVIISS